MKILEQFLIASLILGGLSSQTTFAQAGGDSTLDVETCSFTLKNINKRYVASVSSLGQQQFQTEIRFRTKDANDDENENESVRLTFHEATTNQNFAKCETVEDKTTITIPFNYGQLPIIMNMWRRARGNKNINMQCTVVIKEAESFRRGDCDLIRKSK